MSTPAYELAQYVCAQSAGQLVFAGMVEGFWSVTVSEMSAAPNQAVSFYDEGGEGPDTDELDIVRHLVRVRVRGGKGPTYLETYGMAEFIRDLLIEPAPLETENLHFVGVKVVSNVASEGKDDNDRPLMTMTLEAELQTEVGA